VFPVAIATVLNRPAAHQIHRTSKYFRQLLLHFRPVEQRGARVRTQGRQQIDVALAAKIIAQGGAKQLQPRDSALPAKLPDLLAIKIQLHIEQDDENASFVLCAQCLGQPFPCEFGNGAFQKAWWNGFHGFASFGSRFNTKS
jgi:hypothetical protein